MKKKEETNIDSTPEVKETQLIKPATKIILIN